MKGRTCLPQWLMHFSSLQVRRFPPRRVLFSLLVLPVAAATGCDDVVEPEPEPASVEIVVSDSARLSNSLLVLDTGEEFEISARVLDAEGQVIEDASVVWHADLPDRVAVDDDGTVRTSETYMNICPNFRRGYCVAGVEARSGELVDGLGILILPPPAVFTVEPEEATIAVGDTLAFSTSVTLEGELFTACTVYGVESSDSATVELVPGGAHALQVGSAEIMGVWRDGSTYCHGIDFSQSSLQVTVVEQ